MLRDTLFLLCEGSDRESCSYGETHIVVHQGDTYVVVEI
jgi:hypothetical protein